MNVLPLAALSHLLTLSTTADVQPPCPSCGAEVVRPGLQLVVRATDTAIGGQCWLTAKAPKAFAAIFANVTGVTMQLPGLPLLIDPQIVWVAGSMTDALSFERPWQPIGIDLLAQAAALVDGQVVASPIVVVTGSQS